MRKLFKLIIITLFFINISVKAANETAITNVKVNDESINCENLKCNATVDSDTATIKFTLIDPEATSSGFNSGETFDIPGDSLVKKLTVSKKLEGLDTPLSSEYTFTITKHHESDDATLKKLLFNGKAIELKEEIYSYNVNVTYKQKDISIEAEVNNQYAKLVLPEDNTFDLEESTKSFTIKVTSESGKDQEYIIFVTREQRPDTNIKSIKLSSGAISLEKGVYDYKVNVPYDVNTIDINVTTNDENATVDIKKEDNLVVGENNVEITIKNKELEQKYTIVINRLDNSEDATVNLKELKIDNYDDLDFAVSKTNYELYFDDIPTSLRITATPVNENNDVKINGNYNLKEDSQVTIQVINMELGLSKEYVLTIHKNAISSTSKGLLFIIGGIILFIAIVVATILIILKKKKKKKINKRINIVKKNLEEKEKNKEKDKNNGKQKVIKKEKEVEEEIINDDIEII